MGPVKQRHKRHRFLIITRQRAAQLLWLPGKMVVINELFLLLQASLQQLFSFRGAVYCELAHVYATLQIGEEGNTHSDF